MKPRIAIDWDGTLAVESWPMVGDWLPGAVEALKELDKYFEIVIFSCRFASFERDEKTPLDPTHQLDQVWAMLKMAQLEHLELWTRPYKPPADFYIDDKALRFNGNWVLMLDQIERLRPPRISRESDAQKPLWPYAYHQGISQFETDIPIAPIVSGRHPNSARFHEILAELGELHDRKQQDYGRGDDPFANVRASEEWGINGWVGAMIRLNDKVRRLQSLASKGSLANEAAKDSFMDIAVYALIAYVLYEQEEES